MNALSFEMFGEFEKAIETLMSDVKKEVRCLVLTGEGQHFTAGLDLQSAMKIGSLNQQSSASEDGDAARVANALQILIAPL